MIRYSKKMIQRYLAVLLMIGLLGASSARAAGHSAEAPAAAKQAIAIDNEQAAAPKLILSEPRADVLKDGYVYLPFQVENIALLPMYSEINGEEITKLSPKIGHLHVGVDDDKWVWIHALAAPIYFGPLSSGAHKIRIELVDAAHKLIETQVIAVVVP